MYNISFTFMKVQRGRHALPLTDEETEYLHSQNSFKNQFHKKRRTDFNRQFTEEIWVQRSSILLPISEMQI